MSYTDTKSDEAPSSDMHSIVSFLKNGFKGLTGTNELKIKLNNSIVIARADQCLIKDCQTNKISILN